MTLYAAVFKRSMLPCPEMPPAMFEGVWLSSGMRGIPNDRLWVELPVVQSQRLANGGDNIWVTPPSCHSPKKFKLQRVWTEVRWEIEEYRMFTSTSKDEQLFDCYRRLMVREFHLGKSLALLTHTHLIDPHRVQIAMQSMAGTTLYQHTFDTRNDITVIDILKPVREHLVNTHKISSRRVLQVVMGMGDLTLCDRDVIFQCGRQMLLDDIISGRCIEKWGPLGDDDDRLSVTRGSIDELLMISASSDIHNGPRGRLMYAAVNNWGKYIKPMIRLQRKTVPSQLRLKDHWFKKRCRHQPGTYVQP